MTLDFVFKLCTGHDTAYWSERGELDWYAGLEDNPETAVSIGGIDPSDYGYKLIQEGFESGFHPGQNDKPKEIYKRKVQQGYKHILFTIDRSGQFDVHFSVWHKPEDSE